MFCLAAWAVLYGLSYFLSRLFFPAVLPYAVLTYAAILLSWLGFLQRFPALRIKRPTVHTWQDVLILALLLILPATNLLSGSFFVVANTAILLLGAAVVEEIFFRGVLLAEPGALELPLLERIFEQPDLHKGLISSGVFALFHAVNLFGGAGSAQVVLQIVCAFCAGMLFAAAVLRTDSLIPAVVSHFLVNITAPRANAYSLPVLIGSGICLAAGILLLLPAYPIRKGN